jgi:hypothetical protein
MDPCTGRWWLQIFQRLSKPGCLLKILILQNRFSDSGLCCFWRNGQVWFGRGARRDCEEPSNQQWFWESTWATRQEVTFHSCQIQPSRLWYVKYQMATMSRYPVIDSKLHIQMWGIWRSWLISSKNIVAHKNPIAWLQYTNATSHKTNWTQSIRDYTHPGKWWITL